MSTHYDSALLALPFYRSHPYMLPFVGDDYDSSNHKKLLLVGESHYVPEGSTVHHNANAWYNGAPVLNQEEQNWCNTRGTRGSGHFGPEINQCLNFVLPSGNGWDQVAFLNYFLRPADCTMGIADLWDSYGGKNEDCEQAIRNFVNVLEILKPDLFVFLSATACRQAEDEDYPRVFGDNLWDFTEARGIKYIYTNHPSSPHWNQPMPIYKKSQGLTSRDFFCKWLKENWGKNSI